MGDVTIVVATFGDPVWRTLAAQRAVPSALALDLPVVQAHADTLHDARNQGLAQVGTEWVAHLDADDELERSWLLTLDVAERTSCDLVAPAVRYVRPGWTGATPGVPRVAGHDHDCTADCLPEGNWLVIGTLARTQLLVDVGGWRDWPVYEDWDLWLRCWKDGGALIEAAPQAVYRAHVSQGSRNRGPSQDVKNRAHRAIHQANFGAHA